MPDSTSPASGYISPQGFVHQQILRVRRNLIIANGIALAILLLLLWFCSGYYYCFFRGPRLVTPADILTLAENPGSGGLLDYVELPNQTLVPSGWQEESLTNEKVYSVNPYYFVAIQDKFLLVKTEQHVPQQKTLRGPVQSSSSKVDSEVMQTLRSNRPDLQQKLLPIILNDAAAFNVAGYIGLVFFIPLILLCVYNLVKAFHSLGGLPLHPVNRSLAQLGNPYEIASQIDAEVPHSTTYKLRGILVTEQFLLFRSTFHLQIVRLADIIWLYQLNLSGTHMLIIHQRIARSVSFTMKEADIQTLIHEIHSRIPWIQTGYSAELHKQWQKDRSPLTALVDTRMQKQFNT